MAGMSAAVRRLAVTGPAAPRTCWDRYDELARWPQWAPEITGVEAPGTRLAVGLSGVVLVLGGLRLPFTVTAVDRSQMTWSWMARLGLISLNLHHTVEPDSAGTRATLTIEGPAVVVTAYAPLARFALGRLVR